MIYHLEGSMGESLEGPGLGLDQEKLIDLTQIVDINIGNTGTS